MAKQQFKEENNSLSPSTSNGNTNAKKDSITSKTPINKAESPLIDPSPRKQALATSIHLVESPENEIIQHSTNYNGNLQQPFETPVFAPNDLDHLFQDNLPSNNELQLQLHHSSTSLMQHMTINSAHVSPTVTQFTIPDSLVHQGAIPFPKAVSYTPESVNIIAGQSQQIGDHPLYTSPYSAASSPTVVNTINPSQYANGNQEIFTATGTTLVQEQLVQQMITTDFDNLLAHSSTTSDAIIYPVYSIQQQDSNNERIVERTTTVAFSGSLSLGRSSLSSPTILGFPPPPLPNAIRSVTTFKNIQADVKDYQNSLKEKIVKLQLGAGNLYTVRRIYRAWVKTFIQLAFLSKMMFSCLLNLTTNYLLSNPLKSKKALVRLSPVEREKTLDKLVVLSIKHYARVIRTLRRNLNNNTAADMCSRVSYVLSIMSIYDPEATKNSMICFRDGLFSVLTHTYNSVMSKCRNLSVQENIPLIHLFMLKNLLKSAYYPSYDPTFLKEFQEQLYLFRSLIGDSSLSSMSDILDDFTAFLDQICLKHIPILINEVDNLATQQDLLLDMLHKWTRLFPSKFVSYNTQSEDMIEQVLYLFFMALKRILNNMFPQVRFFFIQDFGSPLILEVNEHDFDYDIYKNMPTEPVELSSGVILQLNDILQLKQISGYLLRVNKFFDKRIALIYGLQVNNDVAFHIEGDIRVWRESITSLSQTRKYFVDSLGLKEIYMKSFAHTLIRSYNYPRSFGGISEISEDEEIRQDNLDFTGLMPNGFLPEDHVGKS
ncbi:uncharacterized protein KQ657_004592 [Scheffersomyces spartinae]|uniref:Uncharacterized protein n=1 Tax=Scheffersomyces spartinae TaxID=45513 RepID=A0A9P7VAY4_9ASCO|nr:uncharacterized protein KQ657_004592 [Scheffersomyces spartinae]KAG7194380.1 hypothetical protein KQ657_004592 [Scheffersomyces spartinae]